MRRNWFLALAALLGFLFLYIPILLLILFSFNESKLVTVWGGLSAKWYVELLKDQQIIDAAWISLKVALLSASIALVFGVMASVALVRFGRFWLRGLLTGMVTAPLVMPEVITGLSLLLLFIGMEAWIGWPGGRGITTVVIAHSTFCVAYIAVVVMSRLSDFDHSVEEAAQDLGAKPLRVFFDITLPIIAPALISGWLLAFTLSLDDVVVANFVSGPGASTLPMVVFSKVRLGLTPEVNALATIMIALVGACVFLSAFVLARSQRRERLAG